MILDLKNFTLKDAGGIREIINTDYSPCQILANTISFNVNDIGIFTKMTELYNTGTVELSEKEKEVIISTLNSGRTDIKPFFAYQFVKAINEQG